MKKLATMMMVVMLSLAGCGSNDTQSTDRGDDGEVDYSQTLLIYSNSASNGRGEWLTEKAAEQGFNIEVAPIPAGDLTNRLISEKNNSMADVVYGLNSLEFERLKAEDLLLEYRPTWADEVDNALGDNQYYYPIVVQPLVLMYNEEVLGDDAPSDWTDLASPEWKDRSTLLGLGGGTAKSVLASILVRYQDPNGELGVSDEGWQIMKDYVQNAHLEISGEDIAGYVISGEIPACMMWGSGVLQHQKERDFQFGIMTPEIGVPYVVEQTAIISKTDKAALAEEFINWFGSAEVQAEWSKQFGTIPAHPVAMESVEQDVKDFMAKVHQQDIDWGFVAQNMDAWMEKIQLEYVQ